MPCHAGAAGELKETGRSDKVRWWMLIDACGDFVQGASTAAGGGVKGKQRSNNRSKLLPRLQVVHVRRVCIRPTVALKEISPVLVGYADPLLCAARLALEEQALRILVGPVFVCLWCVEGYFSYVSCGEAR